MPRKTPVRHKVRRHKRRGKTIQSYSRGSGRPKHIASHKVVGTKEFRTVSEIAPLPQFKTRTIHYDSIVGTFGPHSYDLVMGRDLERHTIEFGTSMSFDGVYVDNPAFGLGITLGFPLDKNDMPKFYFSPYGQLKIYPEQDGFTQASLIDSVRFIREAEVKYPMDLKQSDIMWAVLHVDENDIDKRLEKEERLERRKDREWGGDYSITMARARAESAKELIGYVREHFTILPEVPITPFRQYMRKRSTKIYELSDEFHGRGLKGIDIASAMEKVTEPISRAIAKKYGIKYEDVKEQGFHHIKTMAGSEVT